MRARKTRSVLCLPILKGDSLLAVLCMENELTAGAFTPSNVEILRLLSSQMAIALDNSRLFEDLRRENAERERAETALIALNAELELRVKERTAALEESNRELARSNKELEQFAYIASHDLRAPLRTVTSFTELIRDGYGAAIDDRGRQYLDFVSEGAGRMRLLIDDLLEYARVGRAIGNAGPVSLDSVLEEVLADLRAALEETGGEVASDPLPTVRGHRPQLSQVLHNLLGNALKYRGPAPPRIQLRVRRDGDMCEIAVIDNGAGIDPKHHDTVFQIFRRASRDSDGTGIGLALVSKIVEGHGGRIWLESSLGSGATFRFTLPAAD